MAKLNNPINPKYRDSSEGYTGFLNWYGKGGRGHKAPTNKLYGYPGEYKQIFSRVCTAWHSLSVPEQLEWAMFSENNPSADRYGNAIVIGGFQWFVRLNTLLGQSEQNFILSPPANSTPDYSPTANALQDAITDDLIVNLSPNPSGSQAVFWASSVNLPYSQANTVSSFRTEGFFSASDTPPYIILPADQIAANNRRFKFRFKPIDEFGRSPGLIYDDLVNVTKAP